MHGEVKVKVAQVELLTVSSTTPEDNIFLFLSHSWVNCIPFNQFWWPLRGILVCPDEDTYVGTILPCSTCIVTVTVKPTTEEALDGMQWIYICAYVVVKDGVKAEDITRKNLHGKTSRIRDYFKLHVYTLPAANSCSTVPKEKEKESLLHDNNNKNELHEK